jgi:hypothetical protein
VTETIAIWADLGALARHSRARWLTLGRLLFLIVERLVVMLVAVRRWRIAFYDMVAADLCAQSAAGPRTAVVESGLGGARQRE